MSNQIALSLKEVSHRIGVSKAFLYEEIKHGRLATIKLSKRRLVAVDDMNAYLARHRQMAKAA